MCGRKTRFGDPIRGAKYGRRGVRDRAPNSRRCNVAFAFACSREWPRGDASVASFEDDTGGEFNFARFPSGAKAGGLCQSPVAVFTGRHQWSWVTRRGCRGRVMVNSGGRDVSNRTGERPCDRGDRCSLHARLWMLVKARTSPHRQNTDDALPHGSPHPEIRPGGYFTSGVFCGIGARHLYIYV